ncbi:hypothetical protein [Candidatus Methylacidithermus pantelleriae]|uniref:Putative Phage major capsid protein n=1 Tax=Candidatus Methylacidithermus pantelleriae TaxID=2744239 RepID=A0A8J2FSR0_9BACT|nr:hypothetical protein [Candidatus Methylacidithermus pantelleriae]CAF0700306.1 putative Phage major capsid protein [Candidatus Methylacidithermus pantelleriae]
MPASYPFSGGGAYPTGDLLAAWSQITRRTFLPVIQSLPYTTTPTLAALLADRDLGTGGIAPITQTVQYGPANVGGWIGPAGDMGMPQPLLPVKNAQWTYKWFALPIIIHKMEVLAQEEQAVFDILEVRLTDATNYMMQQFSEYLWYNVPDAPSTPSVPFWPQLFVDPLGLTGFAELVDGPTPSSNTGTPIVSTYGGLPRTDPDLQGNWQSICSDFPTSAVTPTRNTVYQYILNVVRYFGEKPTLGVVPFEVFAAIVSQFIQSEQFVLYPNNQSATHYDTAVDAIRVAGVNIIGDPLAPTYNLGGATSGNLLLINTEYLKMIVHRSVDWALSDFYPLSGSGKLAFQCEVLFMLEMINVRPKMHALFKGLSGVTMV